VEVVVDLHLRPYYGDEDDTDGLYFSQAKDGITAFHAYATLYVRVENKRYTLAVSPSTSLTICTRRSAMPMNPVPPSLIRWMPGSSVRRQVKDSITTTMAEPTCQMISIKIA
jgi:hypothetical protein